jgi:hypothetical protein
VEVGSPSPVMRFKSLEDEREKNSGRLQIYRGREARDFDALMEDLEVLARLDSMIDTCQKRLLHLRGLKSLSILRLVK